MLFPALQEAPSKLRQALVFRLSLALAAIGFIARLGQVAPFLLKASQLLVTLFAEFGTGLTKLAMQLLQLPLFGVELLGVWPLLRMINQFPGGPAHQKGERTNPQQIPITEQARGRRLVIHPSRLFIP